MEHDPSQHFLNVPAAAEKFKSAGFTQSSLRWLAFHRETNGFGSAFLKVGRKLLIDEVEFVACIRRNGQKTEVGVRNA